MFPVDFHKNVTFHINRYVSSQIIYHKLNPLTSSNRIFQNSVIKFLSYLTDAAFWKTNIKYKHESYSESN
jgi:F0F1-type ATP synthase beta subunit